MAVNLSLFAGAGAQFFDNNGVILSGGKIYSYDAGTTTPRASYTSSTGGTSHSNPIILDAAGRVPGGEIWLTQSIKYKFVLADANDVVIATYDNIDGSDGAQLRLDLANTTDPALGDALVGFKQSNSSGLLTDAVARTVHQKLQESVSVLDFGADPTNTNDSSAAIQAALNSGAKSVYIPTGRYKILSTLVIPTNVSVRGDGPGQSILDGSTTTYANLTSGRHINMTEGTFTALPELANPVTKGDETITFASAPSLVANDIFMIYNPTDYSYSGWREGYRASEYLRVASVSGNVVTLQGTAAASYAVADVDVYRYDGTSTCTLEEFSLIGLADPTKIIIGLQMQSCVDSVISHVKVTNCSHTSLSVTRCFNISVLNCTASDDFAYSAGGEYGLAISNCHIAHVIGGYFSSYRHGITVGGFDGLGYVINRYININGAHVTTAGAIQAMDCHGDCEYYSVTNCTIDGGITSSGDYSVFTNNIVRAITGNGGVSIIFAERSGANILIANNIIENKSGSTGGARGAFIDIGGGGAVISEKTYRGGTINIIGNTMVYGVTTNASASQPIKIANRGYAGTEPISIIIDNNIVTCTTQGLSIPPMSIETQVATSVPWDVISVTDNQWGQCGVIRLVHGVAGYASAKRVYIHGNTSYRTSATCIQLEKVSLLASVKNNTISNTTLTPILVTGISAGDPCLRVHIIGNTTFDSLTGISTSSTNNAEIVLRYAQYAICQSNSGGSYNERLVLASNAGFVVGETITGGTSGFTAIVVDTYLTTTLCIGLTATGTFTVGETVTGGTSGASSTVSSQSYTALYRNTYDSILALWQGQNVGIRLSSDSVTSVTTNTPI